tara:strand:+ start:1309 stop:1668 length:360 start_codon:yes stop_codon:yes gene_type:complete
MKLEYAKLVKEYKVLRELERKYNLQKKNVEELKQNMIELMQDVGTNSYSAKLGTMSLTEQEIPIVEDWDALYKQMLEEKSFDMLQRRVSVTAWRDRLEEGDTVAGVSSMTKRTLRINAN